MARQCIFCSDVLFCSVKAESFQCKTDAVNNPYNSASSGLQMAVLPLQLDRWKGGIGFIGYYLEGQQELHTGHSSSLATWSEDQRQLVELSRDINRRQLGPRC